MDNYRTYAHRRLKGEITHLSRLHWLFQYSVRVVQQSVVNAGHGNAERLMAVMPVAQFESQRLDISVSDFVAHIDDHIDHLRLLLLVKACASMEDYLHRIAQIWAIGEGYFAATEKLFLDKRGKALIQPALVSNLESSLNYLSLLIGANFGANSGTCGKAYALRCLAAHNGGVVDHEAIRVFPEFREQWGKPITLAWDELHKCLKAITAVSNTSERAIPSQRRLQGEITVIAGELVRNGECEVNNEPKLRAILKAKYEFHRIPARRKLAEILRQF